VRPVKLHIRFAIPIFAIGAIALAFVLPAVASAAEFTLAVNYTGTGEGEVFCTITEPGEEPREEEFCDGPWPANTKVAFGSPQPETGSEFKGFAGTGNAAGCAKTCSFKLTEPSSVDVRFDLILKKLVVNVTGEGEVECEGALVLGDPCNGEYPIGSEITLTPTPEFGYEFAGFKNGTGSAVACGETDPCSFSLEKDSTVNALFEPIRYVLTVKKSGTGSGTITSLPTGINCGVDCEHEYTEDTEVTLTATASAGSKFVSWADCSAEPEPGKCKVTMDEAKSVEAEFAVTTPGDLKVNKAGTGAGTVTSSPAGINCGVTCEAEFEVGKEVTLTATASAGSKFTGWTGCGTVESNKCKVTMSTAKEVTATFDLIQFTLTINKAGTGSGSVTCDGGACAASYPTGTKVTLAASAASGSSFAGWSGGGCSGTGSCVVTITANKVVTATFTANSVPPTPKPPPPGTAKVAATAKVKAGKAQLKLTCTGGPCKGTLKLKAKVKQGTKTKSLVIGKASFSLAAGTTKTLKVKLSAAAKQAMKGGKTLKAKVSGSGIASSTVKLKS
jgi:hypothetical protein